MKNDEEFIAGIYRKAEERRGEEAEKQEKKRFSAYGWRWLSAAACAFLLAGTAIAVGRRAGTAEDSGINPAYEIEPFSDDVEAGNMFRMRDAAEKETIYGTVAGYTAPDGGEAGQILLTADNGDTISAMLYFDADVSTGDKIALMLSVRENGFFLEDADGLFVRGEDGLFYNAHGSVISESPEGE